MAVKLFSEYQPNVDALARRIAALTSLSSRQAQPVAISLLGRKELKIKSSSLAQIFKQIDSEVNTKQIRNEFLASGLISRIEGTGKDGKPAIYTVDAEVVMPPEDDSAEGVAAAETAVENAVETEVEGEKPGEAGVEEPSDADAEEPAETEREKKAQGRKFGTKKPSDKKPAAEVHEPADADECASDDASSRQAHDEVGDVRDDSVESEAAAEKAQVKKPIEFVSKVGRGARVHRRRGEATSQKPAVKGEEKAVPASEAGKPAEVKAKARPKAEAKTEAKAQPKKHADNASAAKKNGVSNKAAEQGASTGQMASGAGEQASDGADADKKKRNGGEASATHKKKAGAAGKQAEQKKAQPKNVNGKNKAKKTAAPEPKAASAEEPKGAFAAAKAAGLKLVRVMPRPRALAKVERIRTDIVKVETGKPAVQDSRRGGNGGPARKLNDDVATIMAWIDAASEKDVPYASRRQRAYEIFNDEKAFEGKRGERLFRRLNEKGVNTMTLRITPNRPVHFTGFYNIGSNRPFIMVENLDTYDEIVRMLRGRKNARLFGVRVGGVIFGGGCKAAVSHALDDYLDEIGYDYKFIYYAGDIDREGAKIVEQARSANVTEIRLHAGMYKAMLAAHRARIKEGRLTEAASSNQGVPQNLAEVIRDLPVVTRVQFRNVLRAGGRIPQEILTSSDYRDSDSGALDRALNG